MSGPNGVQVLAASHTDVGDRYLYCEGSIPLLFTENETNKERIFGTPNVSPHVKDAINDYVVDRKKDAVNPEKTGTKSSAHYQLNVGAGKTATVRVRLSDMAPSGIGDPFKSFAEIMETRQREADQFYKSITPGRVTEDAARVMRQALAGMLWSKQFFFFDVDLWLTEHGVDPMKPTGRHMRNSEWFHMVNNHIITFQRSQTRASSAVTRTGVGPFGMPVNALLIRGLLQYYLYYGENFKIECPTGSGKMMNLFEVAREIADRLTRIFVRDKSGRRPVFGGTEKFQTDPQWKDYLLFFEYFHGDNGAGLGASHQTGWTGLVAKPIELFGRMEAQQLLEAGKTGGFAKPRIEQVEPASV